MHFSDEALVLSLGRFREADVWLRLLSPSRGLFTAFAFGGSKSRKRFCGCLDSLNRLSVSVGSSGGGDYLCLQEATLLAGPVRLRQDFKRLGPVMNSLKFIEAFGVATDGASEAFGLLKDLLQLSEESQSLPELLPVLFRLRLAFDHGYAIDLHSCTCCSSLLSPALGSAEVTATDHSAGVAGVDSTAGTPVQYTRDECGWVLPAEQPEAEHGKYGERSRTPAVARPDDSCFLLANEGQMFCAGCASDLPLRSGPLMRLSQKSLDSLRLIKNRPLSQWHAIEFNSMTRREVARAIDAFIEYHVGLRWDNGRFSKC